MIGIPFFTELWKRVGTVLSPVNSGDGLSVDAEATFNAEFGDNDFEIKKLTSGTAFNYDAGSDMFILDSITNITDTTQSTSPDTGCLALDGGLGVIKDIYVGS